MNIADSSSHLDYDTLADLAEGLLDDEGAASAGGHLAGCLECRDRSAELADVTRILAQAPLPPLPPELAARIDAALAAEEAAGGPSRDGLDVAIAGSRRHRRLQVLSAAAAAVVVLGGGATVAKIVTQSSVTAADGKAQAGAESSSALGSGPSAQQSLHAQLKESGRAPAQAPAGVAPRAAAAYRLVRTDTDYRDGTLAAQVTTLLHAAPGNTAATAVGVEDCVAALAPGRTPVVVDLARFDGDPATVVVLPGAASGTVDVLVGGPACAAGHPDLRAQTNAAG